MVEPGAERRLTRGDYAVLAAFCLVLFGYACFSGRVLTMHEARLPEASREMLAAGDWIIPRCGGRPWLERPPLPHWITMGVASLFGRCDQVWIVRIPPVLMGLASVLMLAWMTARWFGRGLGMLSGLMLATLFEFTRYAWLAEEDIFLAAAVIGMLAMFTRLEFDRDERPASVSFFGNRPWLVWAFFLALGFSNQVKGLLFAAAMVVISIGGFLLWNADWQRMRRYMWLWGWLVFAASASIWLVLASIQYPDIMDVWFGDVTNRTDGSIGKDPIWYYWTALVWALLPWTPCAIYGLSLTRDAALHRPRSAERLIWCWAILPFAVLSLPTHKHHHYMVPCLAPWAVLAAIGAKQLWQSVVAWPRWSKNPAWPVLGLGIPGAVALIALGPCIPGPAGLPMLLAGALPAALFVLSRGIACRDARQATAMLFGLVMTAYLFAHSYSGMYIDTYREDTRFLLESRQIAEAGDAPVYVNAQGAALNPFRHLFYLGDRGRMLHNLTFLRDERILDREVYVITQRRDEDKLRELGTPEVLAESQFHQRKQPADTRWTLFRVKFHEDLDRHPADVHFTAMQVMEREPGPFLGKRL